MISAYDARPVRPVQGRVQLRVGLPGGGPTWVVYTALSRPAKPTG